MYWVNFLHIYQPSDQSKEILERVANESYRPLFKGLLKIPKCKINLNINGALVEFLVKEGYRDIIVNIKKLAETKRLEFTESAKYHALLPFLDKEEIIRQIDKNYKTNRKYFGKSYQPVCFFPPEMAYSQKVGKIVSELGYPMILLDEITYEGEFVPPPKDKLNTIKGTDNLIAVFRERRVSNCLMSAVVRTKKGFIDAIGEDLKKDVYLCTAMDKRTQEKLDIALASDQFFWASGEPWWSIEMIEKGAWALLAAFKSFPSLKKSEIEKGEKYYRHILSIAFWWQRSGKIGQKAKKYRENAKVPFKKRTLESNKPEVYNAFKDLIEEKMREAARKKNFEKAILWRDAIWKLETKNDIYDAIHAVDLLRTEVPDVKIRKLMDKYKEKYKRMQPGQPETRRI